MLLSVIIEGDFEKILDRIVTSNETDHDFILAVRYLVETRNIETLKLIFENKSIAKMNDRKCVTLAAESTVEIFKMFSPLFNHTFPVESHPLVMACSSGSIEMVKTITSLIRQGKLPTEDVAKLKDFAIKVSARKGRVAVLMELCKTRQQVHNAVASLITNGNHRQIPRMLSHPEIDFSENNFELLKLCSTHIIELMEISRHRTVYENYNSLPADYYRHVVDASKLKFDKHVRAMQLKHKANVKRTAGLILTGARSAGPSRTTKILTREELVKLKTGGSKDTNYRGPTMRVPIMVKTDNSDTKEKDDILEHEFQKRTKKSARTGIHLNHLHEITQKFKKSEKTDSDIKEMVTGVHMYHRHDYDRELRDRKLDKFML